MLEVLFAFPTVIYTVLLGVCLVYWLFVVLGALDLDLLGGGHDALADGAADGALEGSVKGLAEGAAKGMAEGAVKGLTEGATDGLGDVDGLDGADDGPFGALGLRAAPVTVTLTLFAAFAWLTSAMLMGWVGGVLPLPDWLVGLVVFLFSGALSLVVTSFAARPFGRLFVTHSAQVQRDLVGSVGVVSTGRVDAGFGQATLANGGAGLILQVRCDQPGTLKRGDRALLVAWDDARDAFVVEPMEELLPRVAAPAAPASTEAAAPLEGTDAPPEERSRRA